MKIVALGPPLNNHTASMTFRKQELKALGILMYSFPVPSVSITPDESRMQRTLEYVV